MTPLSLRGIFWWNTVCLIIFSNTATGLWGELHHLFWHVSRVVSQMPIIGFWQKLGKWYISWLFWLFILHWLRQMIQFQVERRWRIRSCLVVMRTCAIEKDITMYMMVIVNKHTSFSTWSHSPVFLYFAFCFSGNPLGRFYSPRASEKRNSQHLANGSTVPTLIRSSSEPALLSCWLNS